MFVHLPNNKATCEPSKLVFIKDCLIQLHAEYDDDNFGDDDNIVVWYSDYFSEFSLSLYSSC